MWNNYGRIFAEYMFIKDFRMENLQKILKLKEKKFLNENKKKKINK